MAIAWAMHQHIHVLNEYRPLVGPILWISYAFQFIWLENQEPALDCLHFLLPTAGMLEVSEPFDKAFVILGLTDYKTRPHLWPKDFVVDYLQPYNRVISWMQRAYMAHGEHGVDMVNLLRAGMGHSKPDVKDELPSWIMRDDGYIKTIEMWDKPFTAHNGRAIDPEDVLNAEKPEILSLQGFFLDEIVAVMPVIDGSVLESIAALQNAFLSFVAFIESTLTKPRAEIVQIVAKTLCAGGHIKTPFIISKHVDSDEDFKDSVQAFLECRNDSDYPAFFSSDFHFATAAANVSVSKRLFMSSQRYLGLGPATAEVGDVVSIMAGCRIPFVLRRESNKEDAKFLMNGGCYIDGIMFGEAMRQHVDAGLPMQTIHLV